MYDVTYVETSRKMAERMMHEGGGTPESRIAYGFELATARMPSGREAEVLLASFSFYRDTFQSTPADFSKITCAC
jgi:hypothetical protein